MKCLRCQNEDPRFFYRDHGVWYCRKCVGFSRLDVGIKPLKPTLSRRQWKGQPCLEYELTPKQKEASARVLSHLKQGKDVFLYAATGAGKTECTFESICWYLGQGKKVCFAISRRQVVLEIAQRLEQAFPELSVVAVAQGYTQKTDGDLIVCTMHQLYRYPYSFDLLIMDEIDAFPYADDPILHALANQACIGQQLCLSATPDKEHLRQIEEGTMECVPLFSRPHGHHLIVPDVHKTSLILSCFLLYYYLNQFIKENKPILLFVPTKQSARRLYYVLKQKWKTCYVHSQSEEKDPIIEAFRQNRFDICISTTLLERGITLPGVQVIVWQGQHPVFTTASLVQIFGRVGRSFHDPTGKGVCLCVGSSPCISECVQLIQKMNHSA